MTTGAAPRLCMGSPKSGYDMRTDSVVGEQRVAQPQYENLLAHFFAAPVDSTISLIFKYMYIKVGPK